MANTVNYGGHNNPQAPVPMEQESSSATMGARELHVLSPSRTTRNTSKHLKDIPGARREYVAHIDAVNQLTIESDEFDDKARELCKSENETERNIGTLMQKKKHLAKLNNKLSAQKKDVDKLNNEIKNLENRLARAKKQETIDDLQHQIDKIKNSKPYEKALKNKEESETEIANTQKEIEVLTAKLKANTNILGIVRDLGLGSLSGLIISGLEGPLGYLSPFGPYMFMLGTASAADSFLGSPVKNRIKSGFSSVKKTTVKRLQNTIPKVNMRAIFSVPLEAVLSLTSPVKKTAAPEPGTNQP